MNIKNSELVKHEIERITKLKKDFSERNLSIDLKRLNDGITEINKLLNLEKMEIDFCHDFWEECHVSLHKIMKKYNLKYNDNDMIVIDYGNGHMF